MKAKNRVGRWAAMGLGLALNGGIAVAEPHVIVVSEAELANAMHGPVVKSAMADFSSAAEPAELLAWWQQQKSTSRDPLTQALVNSALLDQLARQAPSPTALQILDEMSQGEVQIHTLHPEAAHYTMPALRVSGRAAALADHWRTEQLAATLALQGAEAVQNALADKAGNRYNKAAVLAIDQLDSASLATLKTWLLKESAGRPALAKASLRAAQWTGDSELAYTAMKYGQGTVSRDALTLLARLDKSLFLSVFDETLEQPLLAGIAVSTLGRMPAALAWETLTSLLSHPELGADAALAMAQNSPLKSLELIADSYEVVNEVVAKRYLLILASIRSDRARELRDQLLAMGLLDSQQAKELAVW